jgi:UDP-glucuronate decarboxylase
MKYVISGITGWLGHAALHVLTSERGVSSSDIVGIGRKRGDIPCGDGQSVKILDWDQAAESIREPSVFLHFAFLTRDKINTLGVEDFIRGNREIIKSATNLISAVRPTHVISVSSGAVYQNPDLGTLANDILLNPYGVLKLEEEVALNSISSSVGASCVISRLWSLSGQDVQNTSPFALYDFIVEALTHKTISIRADHKVFRSYVDARELISLLLAVSETGKSLTFDTGGKVIEIGDLAALIAESFPGTEILDSERSENPLEDRYYSRNTIYDELCNKYLGRAPLSIASQIQNSIAGIKSRLELN